MHRLKEYAGVVDILETDVRPLLDAGALVSNDKVSIRRKAELADIRAAITRTDLPAARWRGRLVTTD